MGALGYAAGYASGAAFGALAVQRISWAGSYATLALVNRLRATLEPPMSCSTPQIWLRGETRELVLTVFDLHNELRDLTSATAIEYQVKTAPGAPDPALVSLALGSGITLRTQSGVTLGQADIAVSSAATDALAPGTYYEEAVLVLPGTPPLRKYVLGPRKFFVNDVVNRP